MPTRRLCISNSVIIINIQQDGQKRRAMMHISRKSGQQADVDWAGDTAFVIDRNTGEAVKAYIFVGAMSYSTYAYAEAFPDTKQASWIKTNVWRHTKKDR